MLPYGVTFKSTDLAFQQEQPGIPTLAIFAASAVFVFLVLAASTRVEDAVAIVLIVPMCLLASAAGLTRGMPIDILAQIGFVVLLGSRRRTRS